ncbi:MAG: glycosyl transferase family protein [Rhodospirillales bacterium]
MTEFHPFAQYIQIIGKGPNLSRPLTEQEAHDAVRMILAGGVEPLQLGAFLSILRLREEVPVEGAGFVRAMREAIDMPLPMPSPMPEVDLDWPAYAGKKRQLPWFILAALLLAQNGVRICMQGTDNHTPGRIYVRDALKVLGLPVAGSIGEAGRQIAQTNFAYLPLQAFLPRIQDIIELKPILGLRSPFNTFTRQANPFRAPYELLTVAHPGYADIHCAVAERIGQPHMAVFKGEGGEAERRPHKSVRVKSMHGGFISEEDWPPILNEGAAEADPDLDLERLAAVWRGAERNGYADAAVTGTAAIVLRLMGKAETPADALARAQTMWDARNKSRLGNAA